MLATILGYTVGERSPPVGVFKFIPAMAANPPNPLMLEVLLLPEGTHNGDSFILFRGGDGNEEANYAEDGY